MLTSVEPPDAETALNRYRPLVEGNDQAIPILLVGIKEQTTVVALTELAGHPTDALTLLAAKIDTKQIERPDWVVFTTEAYRQVFPDGMPKGLARGTLGRSAQAGDKAVEEVVICHCVTRTGGLEWSVFQPFQRLPALDTVKWHPVQRTEAGRGVSIQLLYQIVGAVDEDEQ